MPTMTSPDLQNLQRFQQKLRNILATALATSQSQLADDTSPQATASAIQALVWQNGRTLFHEALGHTALESTSAPNPPVTTDTLFDTASITKALVTATLTMQAVDQNLFTWHTPVHELLPGWNPTDPRAREITILHLLNHSSGLPTWIKFYEHYPLDPSPEQATQTRQAILQEIAATPLTATPGTHYAYSDPGYILLSFVLEHVFATPLEILARTQIFQPLQMHHTDFFSVRNPSTTLETLARSTASTERCPLRKRLITGSVHDENCNVLGGVAGHAGVFSTAHDLAKFARHLLEIDSKNPPANAIIHPRTLAFCWSEATRARSQNAANHLGGWDTPSGLQSSAGRGFTAGNTIGHLGFTGTSLWIERNSRTIAVLLTNRVYPTRDNDRIKALRIAFQEAILPPP